MTKVQGDKWEILGGHKWTRLVVKSWERSGGRI